MSKKRSCPSVGALEQQMALDDFDEAIHTIENYSTGSGLISRYLMAGQRNAVVISQLEVWTGLDRRMIRRQIEQERRWGCPILADNATGYYLAENETEKKNFVLSMRHRAFEILKTAAAIDAVRI